MLRYDDYSDSVNTNPCTKLISALGKIRQNTPALCFGDYRELELQTSHFAYERSFCGQSVIVTLNNSNNNVNMTLPCGNFKEYTGALSGKKATVSNGRIQTEVPANYGEIWISEGSVTEKIEPIKVSEPEKTPDPVVIEKAPEKVETEKVQEEKMQKSTAVDLNKPYEEMTVEELQEAILQKMRKNGPVTDYMLGTVRENTHLGSLINWVKSFNR
jgi:hypothetical protein